MTKRLRLSPQQRRILELLTCYESGWGTDGTAEFPEERMLFVHSTAAGAMVAHGLLDCEHHSGATLTREYRITKAGRRWVARQSDD